MQVLFKESNCLIIFYLSQDSLFLSYCSRKVIFNFLNRKVFLHNFYSHYGIILWNVNLSIFCSSHVFFLQHIYIMFHTNSFWIIIHLLMRLLIDLCGLFLIMWQREHKMIWQTEQRSVLGQPLDVSARGFVFHSSGSRFRQLIYREAFTIYLPSSARPLPIF